MSRMPSQLAFQRETGHRQALFIHFAKIIVKS